MITRETTVVSGIRCFAYGENAMMRMIVFTLCALGLWSVFGSAQENTEHQQYYPNIPTEVIFENDRVLVQRVVIQPGEWEGIHSHSGDQLFINLSDGETSIRYGDEERHTSVELGSVGWQRAVDLSEEHESGNTGDTPLDFLWVNFKQ